MKTYPLKVMSLEQAKEMQFRLVDIIHNHFQGDEFLQNGDYGIVPGYGRPRFTEKVERVLAQFFDTEDAVLVRGAGTGAIRNVMNAILSPGDKILIHDAPIYPTTGIIVESMGLKTVRLDFNSLLNTTLKVDDDVSFALVQHSRQKMEDSYNLGEVIGKIKEMKRDLIVLTDDNYVVMKSEKIGVQLGADISSFSLFKLFGPEDIGCVAGKKSITDKIRKINYSGGSQVQGYEAMEALRALVYTPVAFGVQAEEGNKIVSRISQGEIKGVKSAFIANAQSRVILVDFERPVAKKVLSRCNRLGAALYPVGAESRYEVAAMFYRVSGTFMQAEPGIEEYMIRINPMRAGADTVMRVLKQAVEEAMKEAAEEGKS